MIPSERRFSSITEARTATESRPRDMSSSLAVTSVTRCYSECYKFRRRVISRNRRADARGALRGEEEGQDHGRSKGRRERSGASPRKLER